MKRGIGFGKIGLNLGSLQIKDKDEDGAAACQSATDEGGGGGFGKIDKTALNQNRGDSGIFGKVDRVVPAKNRLADSSKSSGTLAAKTPGAIDNLVESEQSAVDEEYKAEVNPELERMMGFSGFKTNKKTTSAAADKKALQFDVEVSTSWASRL